MVAVHSRNRHRTRGDGDDGVGNHPLPLHLLPTSAVSIVLVIAISIFFWMQFHTLTVLNANLLAPDHDLVGKKNDGRIGRIRLREHITSGGVTGDEGERRLHPQGRISHTSVSPGGFADPCDSTERLAHFFQLHPGSSHRFSKSHPICPSATHHRIHVAIPFRNVDYTTLVNAVGSVVNQDYPRERVNIWLYDDSSDNLNPNLPASERTLDRVCGDNGGGVFDFRLPDSVGASSWGHVYEELEGMDFSSRASSALNTNAAPNLLCFRGTRHLGPGGGKFWVLGIVSVVSQPNDIVLILDGDDALLHPGALEIVNRKYIDTSAWFTYGTHEGKWSEETADLPYYLRNGNWKFKPRGMKWIYGHPRTFKAHLLNHVVPDDFKYSDGSWLTKASDRGLVYRLLELSGPNRISYIPDKIYKYNYSTKTSTLASVSKKQKWNQENHTMMGMPHSSPLKSDIHVVLLTFKRIYLLGHQLGWLQEQTGIDGRIHLHVVNNNQEVHAIEHIDATVQKFFIRQHFLDDGIKPMKITVVHNKGDFSKKLTSSEPLASSHHIFARFVYVQELRKKIPLDCIVFLDDDQYWPEDFVSSLLKQHKPKGMTTWYGKNFRLDSYGMASYWNPIMSHSDLSAGKESQEASAFKYGGPGGSIIDTNLWLLDSQLMRLTSDLICWAKIDDLWVSYVLDALLGWEIRRLIPPMQPIDIGAFRENQHYRRIVLPHLSHTVVQELNSLDLPTMDIQRVATWKNPAVNKTKMFEMLQTDFMWDAGN